MNSGNILFAVVVLITVDSQLRSRGGTQPVNSRQPATISLATDGRGSSNTVPLVLEVDPTWRRIASDPLVTDQGYYWSTGSWADVDGDGDLDLLVITDRPSHNPLYRNNGDGTFERILEPTLQSLKALDWVYCWGDYDNDGYPDLFIPEGMGASLKNVLCHNNGDGTFTRTTNNSIVLEGGRSSGGAWADYDHDGWLDLCVANGSAGGFTRQRNSLYRNLGGGQFAKVEGGPLSSDLGTFDLPTWPDVDNDGWQDLFIVSTEKTYNPLYLNTGMGAFVKITNDPLVDALDIHWGDGTWVDYDNDGDLDLFLTTARSSIGIFALGPVALFQNDGKGHFTRALAKDIGDLADARVDTYVCSWGDYDNDGWQDVYIANCWVGGGDRTDLIYHNNGDGTFAKVTRGSPVTDLGACVGGWLLDVNSDGFLDLIALKNPTPDNTMARYYRNNGTSNSWLAVRCVGTASPRSASGTKVRVQATIGGKSIWQLRVIDPGGFANGQNYTAHFGLGDATNVDVVRIEWTSGRVQELTNVLVKQYLTLTEPTAATTPRPGELQVPCWKDMACTIEASSDLAHWTSLTTVTNLSAERGIQWNDPAGTTQSTRFYAVRGSGFVHPEALASTEWLARNLTNPAVRIVDARYPQSAAAFGSGHIPGAVRVDPLADLAEPASAPAALVPTVNQIQALMSRLGVGPDTQVVAYDTDGGLWCARLWWVLRYYGHDQVRLLEGGLRKWQVEGRPLEKTNALPAATVFAAREHPEFRATFADVNAAIGQTHVVIMDALSTNQHTGRAADMAGWPPGHIPSARNVPSESILNSADTFRALPAGLAATYQQAGVTADKEVILYCGGGYYSAFAYFVLHQLGYQHLRLYEGSWIDWVTKGGAIQTGP